MKDMTGERIVELTNILMERWGEKVVAEIFMAPKISMTQKEFLNHCTACGGNWGGMLLTGINELWPTVYDAIPDNMGMNAFENLCITLELLGVVEGDD